MQLATIVSIIMTILNSYFVIHEIFVIRSITLLCTAKEAFKQTAFTNILRTEVSSKLFYSVTNVFFPQILSTKPQSCSSFLFEYVRDTLFLVDYEACTAVFQLLNV